ncbi:MAG TPA: CpsB/CapC family capsule biosynthesis tyrosine phosphatase [Gaiellaceae bacterium]|nr:CpsB/CapC family capsule biosynthesis tyrosine phosphatase [Gaiellaceae bacterium]
MIDLHSHVLPGLDDGAADMDEALAICRAAAEDGIEVLAATPHVRAHDWPTTAEQMEAAFAALSAAAEGIVRLVPGGELDIEELNRPLEELRRFALAGNPRYLLVETPYYGWPLDMADRLFALRADGITPVLAHPERNADVQMRPELLEPLVSTGTLTQVTAGSVDGRLGRRAHACAMTLIENGWAHIVASDGHAPSVREIGMRAAADAVGDEALAEWLTVGVPRAIVDDARLPERPEPKKKRRFGVF